MSLGIIASSILKGSSSQELYPPVVSSGNITANILDTVVFQIQATNNPTNYGTEVSPTNQIVTESGLPWGLTLDSTTGIISGTLTKTNLVGHFTTIIKAVNADGEGVANLEFYLYELV